MSTLAPKRRLAWAIYDEPGGVGVIVTDLDTDQWASASAERETPARALAIRRLAPASTARGAGSGTLIDQCRAYVLRSQDVPPHHVAALLDLLDQARRADG